MALRTTGFVLSMVGVLSLAMSTLGCSAKKTETKASPATQSAAKSAAQPTAKPVAQKEQKTTLTVSGSVTVAAADLVVTKAVYGDLPNGKSVDVTDKVKGMVKGNTLDVAANNENFGDPAEGVVKKLRVDYCLKGEKKTLEVEEGQTLVVPAKK